jgi:hypothetical protein
MRAAGATVAWIACLSVGCGGTSGGATLGTGAPEDGGTNGRTTDSAAVGDAVSGDEVEPPSPSLAVQPTVWIGAANRTVTFPEDEADPPTGPQKVVLILRPVTGSTTGTITFGDDDPPAPPVDPNEPYPLERTTMRNSEGQTFPVLAINWTISPYAGFVYSIASSGLNGSELTISYVPAELWRDWCALQTPDGGQPMATDGTPICDCAATACHALTSPTQEIDLLVEGDTMQGQLLGLGGIDTDPVAIRLQRVPYAVAISASDE